MTWKAYAAHKNFENNFVIIVQTKKFNEPIVSDTMKFKHASWKQDHHIAKTIFHFCNAVGKPQQTFKFQIQIWLKKSRKYKNESSETKPETDEEILKIVCPNSTNAKS